VRINAGYDLLIMRINLSVDQPGLLRLLVPQL